MTLGNHFPGELKGAAVERRLKPGAVIRVHCEFTSPPKIKYLAVVCTAPFLVLTINSQVNEFVKARPQLLACQVLLEENNHDFLDHDSWAHCVEAYDAILLEDVVDLATQDPADVIRGELNKSSLEEVLLACKASPSMVRQHKTLIAEALEEVIRECG